MSNETLLPGRNAHRSMKMPTGKRRVAIWAYLSPEAKEAIKTAARLDDESSDSHFVARAALKAALSILKREELKKNESIRESIEHDIASLQAQLKRL